TSPPRPRLATVNQRDAFPSYDEDRVGSSAIRLLAHFDKFAKISSPRFPLPQHIRWELLSWYSSWTYACVPAADTGSGRRAVCRRHRAGGVPTSRLKALANAASDS